MTNIAETYGAKIAAIVEAAKASNNGRLIGLAMTESQKFTAGRAVKLGLLKTYEMKFPGYGYVPVFQA